MCAHIWRRQVHVVVSDLKVAAEQACEAVEVGFGSRGRLGGHQSGDHAEECSCFCCV